MPFCFSGFDIGSIVKIVKQAGDIKAKELNKIKEGIAIATETIENEKALNKLIELIKFVNGDTKVIEEFETKL